MARDEPETAARRILVVDDHPVVQQGLAMMIGQESDLEVCGAAGTADEGLRRVEELKPDAVIVDLALGGSSGLDLIRDLARRFPETPVLVLSMLDERVYAERALRAGATGYLMKHEAPGAVVGALRRILGGEMSVSGKVATSVLSRLATVRKPGSEPEDVTQTLSNRELQVFTLLGQGRGTRAIAAELTLSIKTVETHREHIKQKLGLRDSTELVHRASQWVFRQQGL